jgi:hypothetical protein
LYAGATASVTVVYRQLSNVLEIPTAALHYSGRNPTVLVLRNGKAVSVPVTVGITSAGMTQILTGLTDGQFVLVAQATGGGANPGASTGTGRRGTGGTGGTGGFGGGGFGGGGFGSGGFGGGGGGGRGGAGGGTGG